MSLDVPDLGWGPFRRHSPRSVEIDPEMAEQIWDGYQSAGKVISIRPYKEDYGLGSLRRAESFLNQLHRIDREWRGWTRNTTPPNATELVYDANSELLQFRHVALNEEWHNHIRSEMESHYTNADVQVLPATFLPFDEGMYASAAYLELRDPDYLKPIKNFKDSPERYKERDPYDSVAGQMTGHTGGDDAHVIVQMVAKPAFSNSSMQFRNWHSGILRSPDRTVKSMGSTDKLNLGAVLKEALVEPLQQAKKDTERDVQGRTGKRNSRSQSDNKSLTDRFNKPGQSEASQPDPDSVYRSQGEKGFRVNIRIVAIAETPEAAESRVKNTAEAYESFYDTEFGQGFVPSYPTASGVREETLRAARREYVERNLAMGQTTWACVGRYPNVSARQADYTLKKSDSGVPPRTARFSEYDILGYGEEWPVTARERYERREELGWPYDYVPVEDPDPELTRRGRELISKRKTSDMDPWDDEDTYMGGFYQATLENAMHGDDEDQPIFIGVDSNGRPVPITRDELRTHLMGTGYTGQGKSTLMNYLAVWYANTGGGVFTVDPGGDDTFKILMGLRKERLEDVIIIDLGSDISEYRVGVNLLDTFLDPGDPGFAEEVDAKLETVLSLLETDEYQRMKRVSEHIFRGLIEANFVDELPDQGSEEAEVLEESGVDVDLVRALHDFREGEQGDGRAPDANWTIADARDILASKENREEWARLVSDHGLTDRMASYARTLAEMDNDDDKLEPILGRLRGWLESPLLRAFASLRQSTVNIPQAVLDEKVVILKANTASEGLAEKASTTMTMDIWQTFLQMPLPKELRRMERAGVQPPGNLSHDDDDRYELPDFLLCIDELAAVITDDMPLDSMLERGRKRGLRVAGFTQQYHQLSDEQQNALANTGRQISYHPGNSDTEKRRVASIFPGVDPDDIGSLEPYHAYTMDDANEPFEVEMAAPVPPRRSFDEVDDLIEAKEKEYGVHEDHIDPIGLVGRFSDDSIDATESDGIRMTESVERAAVKAVYDTSIREGDPGGAVSLEAALPALRRCLTRLDETPEDTADYLQNTGQAYRNVIANIRDKWIARGRTEEGYRVKAKSPESTIIDLGGNESIGDETHIGMIGDAYVPVTWAGVDVHISNASGTDPDALLIPIPADEQNDSEFVETITGNDIARGESECSTGRSKPGFTSHHAMQAAQEGRMTTIFCDEETAGNVRDTLYAEPRYCRTNKSTPTETHFYNSSRKVKIDGEVMTRGGSKDSVWFRDEGQEQYVLEDDAGKEHARFDSLEAVFNDAEAYPDGDEWEIRRPIVPAEYEPTFAVDPKEVVVIVPPAGLEEHLDIEDLTIAGEPESGRPAIDAVDAPANAIALLEVLREEECDSITVGKALTIATENEWSSTEKTVRRWLNRLADEGALQKGDYEQKRGYRYIVV